MDTMYALCLRVNVGDGPVEPWIKAIKAIGGIPLEREMRGTVLYQNFDHDQDRKTVQARMREHTGTRNFLIQLRYQLSAT